MALKNVLKSVYKKICSIVEGTGCDEAGIMEQPCPKAEGTFIQLDMAYSWEDAVWLSEFRYLKEIGMEYLVVMGISRTSGNTTVTAYPTSLPGCSMGTTSDVVEKCLKNARKMGFKVFLGIGFNEGWWEKAAKDPEWLYAQMRRDNLIAEELFKLYHSKYAEAFYGWYWEYEVDNLHFRTKKQLSVLSRAINLQLEFLQGKNARLPVLFSPFMNSLFSCPRKYADGWSYLFKNTSIREGDIFCPQDCVGGGGVGLDEVRAWFSAFRKAVQTKKGLRFWANTECFDHTDWTSALLQRFIRQMEWEAPFVEKIVTFSYCHYYSPNNIHPGFHQTYAGYVKTGRLELQRPTPPVYARARQAASGKQVTVTWGPAKDNIGVCGYQVFRNGAPLFRTEVQRKYGGEPEGPVMEYTDTLKKKCGWRKAAWVYEVSAFDFAGNVSEPVKTEPVTF